MQSVETATITAQYLGGDRLGISVRGHQLRTDQPEEDGGTDTAPTPTELFLASLAGCVAFYAERYLRRHDLSTDGLVVACDWAWAREPLRVGAVEISVQAPGLPPEREEAFRRVIEQCPIHNTLLQPPHVRFKLPAAGVSKAPALT
jgi:putative redox protein